MKRVCTYEDESPSGLGVSFSLPLQVSAFPWFYGNEAVKPGDNTLVGESPCGQLPEVGGPQLGPHPSVAEETEAAIVIQVDGAELEGCY